jgi:hypothetical protein
MVPVIPSGQFCRMVPLSFLANIG